MPGSTVTTFSFPSLLLELCSSQITTRQYGDHYLAKQTLVTFMFVSLL